MAIREFTTERLYLRPLGPSDQPLYCRLYADPGLMRHIGTPLSDSAAQRAFLIALRQTTAADPTTQVWTIERQAAPIGIAACVRGPAVPDEAELGLMLVAEAQGLGLAVEALNALVDRVFASLRLRRVWTRHASENLASVRLMRRMGFTPLVTTEDEVQWQMLRGQWRELGNVRCDQGTQPGSAHGGEDFAQWEGLVDPASNRKLAAGESAGRE